MPTASLAKIEHVSVQPATNSPSGAGSGDADCQPLENPREQQTPELSASQRVWNAAYDNLVVKHEKLVKTYIEVLAEYLDNYAAEDVNSKTELSIQLKDPVKRQIYMRRLVEQGRTKIERTSAVAQGVGDVIEYIQKAKGLIDVAVSDIPQAALPWAGVCVGLQVR